MINESYPILNQKYYLLQKLGQGATSCVFLGCPIIGLVDYGVGQLRRTNKFQIKNST